MAAYYNEHDPFAAAWLRNLIAARLIAPGEVDERDIRDVAPDDLRGFTQTNFFAGIGGWSLAARLAGIPDDFPLWTGSCPCQSFSTAGRGAGFADERHLWPSFFHLIRECRPPLVFGEQVEAAVRHGWLDLVCSDLEGEGYAVGAAVLGAHSVGAPHIRQRLWWVAHADHESQSGWRVQRSGESHSEGVGAARERPSGFCAPRILADSLRPRLEGRDARALGRQCETVERGGEIGGLGDARGSGSGGTPEAFLARKEKAVANGASLGVSLTSLSLQAAWATPTARDHQRGTAPPRPHDKGVPLSQQVSGLGPTSSGFIAKMGAPGQLNPDFSLWLMGYGPAWSVAARRISPLSRHRKETASAP